MKQIVLFIKQHLVAGFIIITFHQGLYAGVWDQFEGNLEIKMMILLGDPSSRKSRKFMQIRMFLPTPCLKLSHFVHRSFNVSGHSPLYFYLLYFNFQNFFVTFVD
jgi:hypothetical protein